MFVITLSEAFGLAVLLAVIVAWLMFSAAELATKYLKRNSDKRKDNVK